MAAPAIIVHSLDQAEAAATAAEALGRPLTLRVPAGGLGVGWCASLADLLAERHPGLDLALVLDCADEAGTALGALRRGIRAVRVAVPDETRTRLAALAEAYGAVLDTDDRPALDLATALAERADLGARCRDWLSI